MSATRQPVVRQRDRVLAASAQPGAGRNAFEVPLPEKGLASHAPMIQMANLIIASAVKRAASDIHIESTADAVVVRCRLDGLLQQMLELPKWLHEGLVARLKLMGEMDIAEQRLPQDGRISFKNEDGREIDLRVSSLRTVHGEKIVLRILDSGRGVPPLEELGFSAAALERIRGFLRCQHGMILCVGPTGSGKTTTLFSALASIHSRRTNIVTIEEPVEYQLPGINQTQINPKINLTFASALRSILRQDPDVVLVGEIRDLETASVAMQAAQTGHLVLSTLHTDDAPSCVTRLTDLGVEPYVTASTLIGVIAQRLVRRVCIHCRHAYTPDPETLRAMAIPPEQAATLTFYRAIGCPKCNDTGYRGRIAIYEIMPITEAMRRHIVQRSPHSELRQAALAAGMAPLGEDGLLQVKAGVTTPQELLRVVTEVVRAKSPCPACASQITTGMPGCVICGDRNPAVCPRCGSGFNRGTPMCLYCSSAPTMPTRAMPPRSDYRSPRPLPLPPGPVAGVN